MNNEMVRKLLADPEFLKQAAREYEEKLEKDRRAKDEFIQSTTFQQMVAALRNNPTPVSVSCDDIAYRPDKVKAEAGWNFATQEDMDMFVKVLAHASADTVTPGSHSEDDDCMFDNTSFGHYGLHVFVMHGQGSFVRISNRAKA